MFGVGGQGLHSSTEAFWGWELKVEGFLGLGLQVLLEAIWGWS